MKIYDNLNLNGALIPGSFTNDQATTFAGTNPVEGTLIWNGEEKEWQVFNGTSFVAQIAEAVSGSNDIYTILVDAKGTATTVYADSEDFTDTNVKLPLGYNYYRLNRGEGDAVITVTDSTGDVLTIEPIDNEWHEFRRVNNSTIEYLGNPFANKDIAIIETERGFNISSVRGKHQYVRLKLKGPVDEDIEISAGPPNTSSVIQTIPKNDLDYHDFQRKGNTFEYVGKPYTSIVPSVTNPITDTSSSITSDILIGQLFYDTDNTATPGKLFAGNTYNWSDNPKLKAKFDANGHNFITDEGDGTFTIADHTDFIRPGSSNIGLHVDDTTARNGLRIVYTRNGGTVDYASSSTMFNDAGSTWQNPSTPSINNGGLSIGDSETAPNHRKAYFGIYGDLAVLVVNTNYAEVLNEDDFSSNSEEGVPTQKSVKTYVDTQIASATPDAGGVANWDSTKDYQIGNLVTLPNKVGLYQAQTANTNKNPETSTADWAEFESNSVPITVRTEGLLQEVGEYRGSFEVSASNHTTVELGFDLNDCEYIDLTFADADRTNVADDYIWHGRIDIQEFFRSKKAMVGRDDNQYIWVRYLILDELETGKIQLRRYNFPTRVHLLAAVGYKKTTVNTIVNPKATLIDEDDFVSDSDTAVPTQQSVKAYVDNFKHDAVTLATDSNPALTIENQELKLTLPEIEKGIDTWDSTKSYAIGELVTKEGEAGLYQALTSNTNQDPKTDDGTNWVNVAQGVKQTETISGLMREVGGTQLNQQLRGSHTTFNLGFDYSNCKYIDLTFANGSRTTTAEKGLIWTWSVRLSVEALFKFERYLIVRYGTEHGEVRVGSVDPTKGEIQIKSNNMASNNHLIGASGYILQDVEAILNPEVDVLDEDSMESNRKDAVPTQQSVKSYVDTNKITTLTKSFTSAEFVRSSLKHVYTFADNSIIKNNIVEVIVYEGDDRVYPDVQVTDGSLTLSVSRYPDGRFDGSVNIKLTK